MIEVILKFVLFAVSEFFLIEFLFASDVPNVVGTSFSIAVFFAILGYHWYFNDVSRARGRQCIEACLIKHGTS